MMAEWRFRSNWRGKLILQRLYKWREYDCYGGPWNAQKWEDAKVSDMLDYYKQIEKVTNSAEIEVKIPEDV